MRRSRTTTVSESLERLGPRRAVSAAALILFAAMSGELWAQPSQDSVRGADLYLNRKFGKVPLDQVPDELMKEFNLSPSGAPLERVPKATLKEFNVPLPAQATAPAQAIQPNIYGVPEGEVAIEAAAEASAALGPGVTLSVIQPGWIERGDLARMEFRAGPADTHARLTYDVPSDLLSAQWLTMVVDYSLQKPAHHIPTAPKYRSGMIGFNWMRPFSNEWIGDWLGYWGVRVESRGVETTDPVLSSFYETYGHRARYIVPNAGLSRVNRQSQHPLSEGKSESINVETSLAGTGANFWKAEYRRDQYWEMDDKLTFNLYTSAGYAKTWSPGAFPLAQRFLATGRDAVRGFSPGTIGPTDPGGNPIGGLRKFVASGEAYLLAGTILEQPFYLSVFADVARLDQGGIGYDSPRNYLGYGVGLTWRAASGMVKFNFARPINPQPGDRTQQFTFELKTMMR